MPLFPLPLRMVFRGSFRFPWMGGARQPCVPEWGKPHVRERNPLSIALWHDLLGDPGTAVDGTTWQDLGLEALFARVDRTMSMPGRQWLYHRMRTYEESDARLAEQARQYDLLRRAPGFREKARAILGGLDGKGAFFLAPLLQGEWPERPGFAPLLPLCSLAGLFTVGGVILFPHAAVPFLLAALPVLALNLAINLTYGKRITPLLQGFSQVGILLGVCRRLSRLPGAPDLPQLARCRDLEPMAARLGRSLLGVPGDPVRSGDLGDSILGYLNMILLLDVIFFLLNLERLKKRRPELLQILEAVASLDAALAVASYLDGLPVSTTPEPSEGRSIQARGLYHPLLDRPAPNDLDLAEGCALITGSNMAGKTTFMRTVGLNLILARTLNLCHAAQARFPRARVESCIRREDNLEAGKSYHFAELERILTFLKQEPEKGLRLFLLDEPFRGTNTLERLASSGAILGRLAGGHLVLVTSHDLELERLLGPGFRSFHFSEQVVGAGLSFDYRLREGRARSRNGIKLLEIMGYPAAVIEEAHRFANGMSPSVEGQAGDLTGSASQSPEGEGLAGAAGPGACAGSVVVDA